MLAEEFREVLRLAGEWNEGEWEEFPPEQIDVMTAWIVGMAPILRELIETYAGIADELYPGSGGGDTTFWRQAILLVKNLTAEGRSIAEGA